MAFRGGHLHRLQCLFAARGNRRLHIPADQDFFQNPPIGGIIIDHQHAQARQVQIARSLQQSLPDPSLGREMEDAALALFTLHPETAAHCRDQLGRDGQPKARAPIFTGGGAIGLGKRLKYLLLTALRNANSRVAHGKMQQHGLRSPRLDRH